MKEVNGLFTRYEFDDDIESRAAAALSPLQKAFVSNEMAIAAEKKNALRLDPYKPLLYTQEAAFVDGQIAAFAYLLEASKAAEQFFADARASTETSGTDGADVPGEGNWQQFFAAGETPAAPTTPEEN